MNANLNNPVVDDAVVVEDVVEFVLPCYCGHDQKVQCTPSEVAEVAFEMRWTICDGCETDAEAQAIERYEEERAE